MAHGTVVNGVLQINQADLDPVVSTKTVGTLTLTLYTSGRVLAKITATGAGVRAGIALQTMYPSLP